MKKAVEKEHCERCGRKLRSEKSRELGFGPVCYAKEQAEKTLVQDEPENGLREEVNQS